MNPILTMWDIETVDTEGYVGAYTSLGLDVNGYPAISCYDATNDDLKFARYVPVMVLRGCADTSLSGWRSIRLPLTEVNDDEAPPFPILTSIPGEVLDDNFPCQNPSPDLLLYRVLLEGTAPAGNILRAAKQAGATLLTF